MDQMSKRLREIERNDNQIGELVLFLPEELLYKIFSVIHPFYQCNKNFNSIQQKKIHGLSFFQRKEICNDIMNRLDGFWFFNFSSYFKLSPCSYDYDEEYKQLEIVYNKIVYYVQPIISKISIIFEIIKLYIEKHGSIVEKSYFYKYSCNLFDIDYRYYNYMNNIKNILWTSKEGYLLDIIITINDKKWLTETEVINMTRFNDQEIDLFCCNPSKILQHRMITYILLKYSTQKDFYVNQSYQTFINFKWKKEYTQSSTDYSIEET